MNKLSLALLTLTTLYSPLCMAQFKVINHCNPFEGKNIEGHAQFNRAKYICLSADSENIASTLQGNKQSNYFFRQLGIQPGRQLGMVHTAAQWEKAVVEDPQRKGYADLNHLKKAYQKRKQTNTDQLQGFFGPRQGLALHDKHNTYPKFMPFYTLKGAEKECFPTNNDAAAELAAHLLQHRYNDFTRPTYYEPVNEPHWAYWKDPRFAEHHLKIKEHVDRLGLDTEVGGPCLPVSYFYGKHWNNMKGITQFMEATDYALDFYSFHTYDYYRWNEQHKEFEGRINSGLPLEGVLDALASYTHNTYGKAFTYVASEHGGYLSDKANQKAALDYYADTYFPGEGFKHEMQRRSVDNFLMISSAIANTLTFINSPHIVKKAVPFILLDTSNWDPYYYASMMIRQDFDKKNPTLVPSKLLYFYEFFEGIQGQRINSWCDQSDIQHVAFAEGKQAQLIYHNQSNESGEISLNLPASGNKIKKITVRRLGREEEKRTPYFKEEKANGAQRTFSIAPQESIALLIEYQKEITFEKQLEEKVHYATTQAIEFKGKQSFLVATPQVSSVQQATLRVGVSRKNGKTDGIKICINGHELKHEVEHCAPRLVDAKEGYGSARILNIPTTWLKTQNQVTVEFTDGEPGGVGAVVIRTLD